MRLTETTMAVRPRSNWEALDIGTLLARRHAFVLLAGWASITLPIFVLLSLAFWEQPGVAVLLFWWLKPLFERLPLHVLSQALFGEAPSLRQSLRAWPGLLRHQWLPSLTWRRLSMTRSFDLPVVQLEQLAGRERSRRLATLHRHSARTARWLTLVGVHLEGLFWLGLSALLLLLLPSQALQQLSWQELLLGDHDWLWLEHLSNLLYVLGLIIWEPIYVACGFSLYLNRRTRLEAWDIELSFRRLRQRLLPGLLLAPLAFSLCLAGAPDRAQADDSPAVAPSLASPADDPLSRDAASERIQALLEQPPFHQHETVTRWRLGDEPQSPSTGWLDHWSLGGLRPFAEQLATVVEVLFWTLLVLGVAALAWRYRQWLRVFGWRPPANAAAAGPERLLGLEIAPQSLPDDVAGEAEQLWAEHPRAAVSLLYRALLSRLLHDYGLPLHAAHTEAEVLQCVQTLGAPELRAYTDTLTRHWLRLAYGHLPIGADARDQLCGGWRALFEGARPS